MCNPFLLKLENFAIFQKRKKKLSDDLSQICYYSKYENIKS
jgi:hypothetical protein